MTSAAPFRGGPGIEACSPRVPLRFTRGNAPAPLRGEHVRHEVALHCRHRARDTIECTGDCGGVPLDLVTHDLRKFCRLLLKKNGYVLEQLHSPLIVHTTPEHAELREIAHGLVTRHHAHHYLGFARTQWRLFEKERRLKPLLYVYRVLLTGIHLMRTGEVEANLVRLNEAFKLRHVDDLIAQKIGGAEQGELADAHSAFHEREIQLLTAELEQARDASGLPDAPIRRDRLNAFLIRQRLDQ